MPQAPELSEDLALKVAFLESRLTLLERKLSQALSLPDRGAEAPPQPITFACTAPGLLVTGIYPVERDEDGAEYCWIGNDGPIQIVLPTRPARAGTCVLHLTPHPAVDLRGLTLQVNDDPQPAKLSQTAARRVELSFPVPASGAPNVSILLLGLTSVRPSDFGENSDHRLLAARFFGATLTFP